MTPKPAPLMRQSIEAWIRAHLAAGMFESEKQGAALVIRPVVAVLASSRNGPTRWEQPRRRVVDYGFNSNGRCGPGGLIPERFRDPIL